MKKETMAVSERELQRWQLIGLVDGGKITLKEASEKMGVSYRHAKRLRRRARTDGLRGLVHAGRGRPATNMIITEVRGKVVSLSAGSTASLTTRTSRRC